MKKFVEGAPVETPAAGFHHYFLQGDFQVLHRPLWLFTEATKQHLTFGVKYVVDLSNKGEAVMKTKSEAAKLTWHCTNRSACKQRWKTLLALQTCNMNPGGSAAYWELFLHWHQSDFKQTHNNNRLYNLISSYGFCFYILSLRLCRKIALLCVLWIFSAFKRVCIISFFLHIKEPAQCQYFLLMDKCNIHVFVRIHYPVDYLNFQTWKDLNNINSTYA